MPRTFLTYFLLSFFTPATFADRVFPEELLNQWGYETTKLNEHRHSIKSIDNKYGAESEIAYYARFELWHECLRTPAEAASKISALTEDRNSDVLQRPKVYQREIQQNECIYYIKTYVNETFLSYQPSLMDKIQRYISK